MPISLKELKKNRLTPAEKFVFDTIEGAKPTTYPGGDVFWVKDGDWLFTQDFDVGYLSVSYPNIRSVLEVKFGLSRTESQELLTNLLYDYTDNGKLKIRI